jgi:hypothetical protein
LQDVLFELLQHRLRSADDAPLAAIAKEFNVIFADTKQVISDRFQTTYENSPPKTRPNFFTTGDFLSSWEACVKRNTQPQKASATDCDLAFRRSLRVFFANASTD